MNPLVERIKHHQDAGHAQRMATCRNPSIVALLVCGIALALMMTACFSPSATCPPSTATVVRLDDGSRIEIGSVPSDASWQEYMASARDVLLQIVSSYQPLADVTPDPSLQDSP